MSDTGEHHDPQKLERLLQRWGSGKSVEASRPPAAPEFGDSMSRRPFWRWSMPLPAAVAVMILVALAAMIFGTSLTPRRSAARNAANEPAPTVPEPKEPVAQRPSEDSDEIRQLKMKLAQNQAALEETQHLMKRWTTDRDRLHDAIDKLMADLKTRNAEVRELAGEKDLAGAALAKQSREIMVLQDAYAQQMLVLRDQKRLMLKLYLQISAKDKEGLPALQAAVIGNELIERCTRRRRLAGPSEALLLDRVDGMLTRLCLLGPEDSAGLDALRDSIDKSKLNEDVAKVLAAASSESSSFWMEISLILMGVDHVA